MYECLFCGRYYSKADSEAKNTPPEFSTFYCSLEHKDKHEEEMSSSKTEEFKDISPEAAVEATEPKTIDVGGFKLKVRS